MSFKKTLFWTVIGLGILTFILLAIVYSFMDMKLSNVDGKGERVDTVKSPANNYRADTYFIYGNTSDKDQVRVSVTGLKNNEKFKDTTIYWLYPANKDLPQINWLSEEIIEIEHKEIDINNKATYYNWQKDKSLAN